MFSTGVSPVWSINHSSCLPYPVFFFALCFLQLGCATTPCYGARTVARVTITKGVTAPPASRASCVRELTARAPGSAMTSCLDEPPSISPRTAAGSLGASWQCNCWLFSFAERSQMTFHPQPKTYKITFTESEPLGLEDTKDRGCRDVLKVHYKQLFCISRAVVLLVQQVMHWIVRASMKQNIRLMEE